MAWSKNTTKKAEKADRKRPEMYCRDWLLYCFGVHHKEGSSYVFLDCKVHAGKLDDGSYAPSIPVTVIARIEPDSDGKQTEIEERDYSRSWIRVDGQMSTDTYNAKDGSYVTKLQLWATKVKASEE